MVYKNLLMYFTLLTILLTPEVYSQIWRWNTTRGGSSGGECSLISSKVKLNLHPFHIDVEEEAVISPTGEVVWGDQNTLEILGTFTLSQGCVIRSMLVWWNDTTILKAKLRDRVEADSAYEEVVDREQIVFERKDPALIEYLGSNRYRIKIYPFSINQSRKLRILYSIPMSVNKLEQLFYDLKFIFLGNKNYNSYPQEIPIKVSIDSLCKDTFYLEYNNKRMIQDKGIYILKYNDFISNKNIRISGAIAFNNKYYEYSIDSGDIAGKYFLLFVNVPDTLFKSEGKSKERYTLETVINANDKMFIYEIDTLKKLVFYIKASEKWNGIIKWNRYNSNGVLDLSLTDTIKPDTTVNYDLSILPLLWAAKYTITNNKGNVGAYYGFVDNVVSLLALEKDSLPSSEREKWEEGGVPLLTKEEIMFKKSEVKAPPAEDVIMEMEIPVSVEKTVIDHTSVFSIFLKEGNLLIQSDNLVANQRYTLYLIDLKGRVVFRKEGRVLENGKIVLGMPKYLKGAYILKLLCQNKKIEKMLFLK